MEEATMDSTIIRQRTDTPQDERIRDKLNRVLSTEWSRVAIDDLRGELTDFFTFSLSNPDNTKEITARHAGLVPRLAEISRSHISSGEENLQKVRQDKAVLVLTNHFGIGILTIIDNKDGKFPVLLPEFAGFPVRLASVSVIARRLNAPLYETAVELPPPLSGVQKTCGTIIVPAEGEGRTQKLIDDVSAIVDKQPGAVIIMYPEGGTSGKRNEGGPYDLDTFHKGAFACAAQTGLPILPVCQYFNPETGFELHILEPIRLGEEDLGNLDQIKESTKAAMQKKLVEVSSNE